MGQGNGEAVSDDVIEEMKQAVRQFREGARSFADEMRAKDIHVGMGKPGTCVTCDETWPCSAESRRETGPA